MDTSLSLNRARTTSTRPSWAAANSAISANNAVLMLDLDSAINVVLVLGAEGLKKCVLPAAARVGVGPGPQYTVGPLQAKAAMS